TCRAQPAAPAGTAHSSVLPLPAVKAFIVMSHDDCCSAHFLGCGTSAVCGHIAGRGGTSGIASGCVSDVTDRVQTVERITGRRFESALQENLAGSAAAANVQRPLCTAPRR